MKINYRHFIFPVLIAFAISAFYIVKIPTGNLKNDALEYDKLADSILVGQFSIDGKPSMEREPGYPFFRADVKTISKNPEAIRWAQCLLYILTVIFVGIVVSRMAPESGAWGIWGASLSYALAFYPATHLSETLTAFLLASVGISLSFAIDHPSMKNWLWISLLSGALLYTRYTYILIPVACFIVLAIISTKNKVPKKNIIRNGVLSFLIVFTMLAPWVARNYLQFGQINVAGRSGGILYARALQASSSWRTIPDSLLSVLVGRGILFTVYPTNQSTWLEQWGDWWRDPETIKKMWGTNPIEIDANRRSTALKMIFANPESIVKFTVWSGVNELRFLELPNPIIKAFGSPFEGTYGPLAKEGKLSKIQLAGLAVVHFLQLLWFISIAASLYFGFKKYSYKFIPGIFLISIMLPHLVADNIARYSAPLQPWLLSAIFITILLPLYNYAKHQINKHFDTRL